MSNGFLRICTRAAADSLPVPGVTVLVTLPDGSSRSIVTDSSGCAQPLAVEAPDRRFSLDEDNTAVLPYAVCALSAAPPGYAAVTLRGVQIFDGVTTLADLNLVPQQEGSVLRAADTAFDTPVHALFAGGGGSAPAPAGADAAAAVLREVVIPDTIVVHLGKPAAAAQNVTVSFRSYLKNVASSEIYPTWPTEALRANICAQISLALNRIFTEWYRSRGYAFDITNSTSYDQYYVHGRTVFDSISAAVDEIFDTYLRRRGTLEPYYAEYCDGKSVTCAGMSQWGSKALADQGFSAPAILRRYYGDSIELVTCANIGGVRESYPGTPLRLGSSGTDVRVVQRQLNRIVKNYPFLGAIPAVDGVFGVATDSTVKKFQTQFGLACDGVVGRATWYKISYIYVSVKKLAELTSEGELPTGEPAGGVYPGAPVQLGSRGAAVRMVQFWLSQLSDYLPGVPAVAADGVFGAATAAAVRAYQQQAGLAADGVVGPETWQSLYDAFADLENDLTPPGASGPAQYPGAVLRQGASGSAVRMVQFWLAVLSDFYAVIPAPAPDGSFGPATDAAVRAFQGRFGLAADGAVGPDTWNKLTEIYADLVNGILGPDGTPGVYPGAPLRLGSTGAAVREAQFYLYLLSAYYAQLPDIAYDGVFGPATRGAVVLFQTLCGQTVDGVIGPATWQAIYGTYLALHTADGPVVAFAAPAWPGYPLTAGMAGGSVLALQRALALAARCCPALPAPPQNGSYDDATARAADAFAALAGLPGGEAGEPLWAALAALRESILAAAGPAAPAGGAYPGCVLTLGSAGPAVRQLQSWLDAVARRASEAGFTRADGWFDAATAAAVREFQLGSALTATGFADRATWAALAGSAAAGGRAGAKTRVLVYDEYEDKIDTYYRDESEAMPYAYGTTLRLREFRGASASPTLWTTVRAMESWNQTRRLYGAGIPVGYAFKRIWEGGHGTTSQHYAGVAFDVGQTLGASQRRRLWQIASDLGVWGYVEPLSMTPTWVHFDRRYGKPACGGTGGYPTLRKGARGAYVLVLQDALNALGYSTKTLDGAFGANTAAALTAFQRNNGLTADGICGCASWRKLALAACGIGRTKTVLD